MLSCLALGLVVLTVPSSGAPPESETYSFVSAPNLHPPKLQVVERKPGLARGDFLVTAPPGLVNGHTTVGGPLLLDSQARPVWFSPIQTSAINLQQQTYAGKPVLVVWEQRNRDARVVVYDEHYRRIASVSARSPWRTDSHDAWITGGDIWIAVARPIRGQDLTRYGGPAHATVEDVGAQEFDLNTGRLIATWDALHPGGKPNIPLSASREPAAKDWDPFHLNSVQGLPNGDLLLSMRNTWAVYLVDPDTNRTIWTLGGKRSSFTLGPGASFAWQHDVRLVHPGQGSQGRDLELTLFNNNNSGETTTTSPSEGMVLSLNTVTRRAALVKAYRHDPPLSAPFLGSTQLLPGGDVLVGWGVEPNFTEYSKSGRELLDVRWPGGGYSYRTLFTPRWVGTPYYPPSGAARGSTIYASWNGATEVARWEVLAGSSAGKLTVVAKHPRLGFETAIKLGRTYRIHEVRALSGAGRVLGTSMPFSETHGHAG